MKKLPGFTLVELLVVMAVIAVLAIVVIAALQPMEQMRKTRDKRRLGEARELLLGYDRYLVSFTRYPWTEPNVTAADATLPDSATAINPDFSTDQDSFPITDKGELKSSFAQRASIVHDELWVSLSADGFAQVCFEPESHQGRTAGIGPIKNKLNDPSDPAIDCTLPYPSGTCYVCLPF